MGEKFEIVRTARGRSEIIDAGSRQKMNQRLRALRASTHGGRVSGRGGKKYSVTYELRQIPDLLSQAQEPNRG
jgi:hypothetical protein